MGVPGCLSTSLDARVKLSFSFATHQFGANENVCVTWGIYLQIMIVVVTVVSASASLFLLFPSVLALSLLKRTRKIQHESLPD